VSTVDHIVAACGSLRASWGWLAAATAPGRVRRNQRPLSAEARTRQDKQAAAERNERHRVLTSGHVPSGNTKAPANLAAIDVRGRIAEDVDHAAWLMASAMRNDRYAAHYRPAGANADTRLQGAVDWISTNAPRLTSQPVIDSTYKTLTDADRLARNVVGEGPAGRPFAAECPACGRRSLVWDMGSIDYREWHVRCTNEQCRCDGRDCNCRIAGRVPGSPHVWLESAWNRLADQLNAKETP
jgi:hypothetical protein